jgi:dienelactone hydrolase
MRYLLVSLIGCFFLTINYGAVQAQSASTIGQSTMPKWRDAPAYAPELAKNVLRRSVFFMPMFGAVYPEKFETLLEKLPPKNLRGVVIYSHGCGGQWGWETGVSQFFYRLGFAVITPEFPSRDGNKLGCPGTNAEEALQGGGIRAKEGIYTAMNPARLAARATDVMTVVDWLKARTRLPILIGGHSEGCRTTYSLYLQDPQVVGGICVKQGLQTGYMHTWRWNTEIPMWQSLEEFDPWVVFPPGTKVQDVSFGPKFRDMPQNHTLVIVPGSTHNPLNHENERASLTAWLDKLVPKAPGFNLNGFDYEAALPDLQGRLRQ